MGTTNTGNTSPLYNTTNTTGDPSSLYNTTNTGNPSPMYCKWPHYDHHRRLHNRNNSLTGGGGDIRRPSFRRAWPHSPPLPHQAGRVESNSGFQWTLSNELSSMAVSQQQALYHEARLISWRPPPPDRASQIIVFMAVSGGTSQHSTREWRYLVIALVQYSSLAGRGTSAPRSIH